MVTQPKVFPSKKNLPKNNQMKMWIAIIIILGLFAFLLWFFLKKGNSSASLPPASNTGDLSYSSVPPVESSIEPETDDEESPLESPFPTSYTPVNDIDDSITPSPTPNPTPNPTPSPTPNPTPNPDIGIRWRSITLNDSFKSWWSAITFGNNLFVAIASTSDTNLPIIMTSTNGEVWTRRETPTGISNSNRSFVGFGNNLFLSLSWWSSTPLIVSQDGINWSHIQLPNNQQYYGGVYGNDKWVLVVGGKTGSGDVIVSTTNFSTWTSQNSNINKFWKSIAFGNGIFVAVAYGNSSTGSSGNRVMTSTDGFSWASETTPTPDTNWTSVAFGRDEKNNPLFVAVGDGGSGNRLMTSPNGKTWTSISTPTDINTNTWKQVFYANNLWVAIAYNATNTSNLLTSSNGRDWTIRTSPSSTGWSGLTYGNNKWVAVKGNNSAQDVMVSP